MTVLRLRRARIGEDREAPINYRHRHRCRQHRHSCQKERRKAMRASLQPGETLMSWHWRFTYNTFFVSSSSFSASSSKNNSCALYIATFLSNSSFNKTRSTILSSRWAMLACIWERMAEIPKCETDSVVNLCKGLTFDTALFSVGLFDVVI